MMTITPAPVVAHMLRLAEAMAVTHRKVTGRHMIDMPALTVTTAQGGAYTKSVSVNAFAWPAFWRGFRAQPQQQLGREPSDLELGLRTQPRFKSDLAGLKV